MLEVQKFDDETWRQFLEDGETGYVSQEGEERHYIGKFVHVGYMKKKFSTQRAAAEYYNAHNSHMKALNAHGTWKSDWDPITHLRYVPRIYYGARMTVSSFD